MRSLVAAIQGLQTSAFRTSQSPLALDWSGNSPRSRPWRLTVPGHSEGATASHLPGALATWAGLGGRNQPCAAGVSRPAVDRLRVRGQAISQRLELAFGRIPPEARRCCGSAPTKSSLDAPHTLPINHAMSSPVWGRLLLQGIKRSRIACAIACVRFLVPSFATAFSMWLRLADLMSEREKPQNREFPGRQGGASADPAGLCANKPLDAYNARSLVNLIRSQPGFLAKQSWVAGKGEPACLSRRAGRMRSGNNPGA
jgi:hypothetical protein